jgi:hypothetical protein
MHKRVFLLFRHHLPLRREEEGGERTAAWETLQAARMVSQAQVSCCGRTRRKKKGVIDEAKVAILGFDTGFMRFDTGLPTSQHPEG